jgi:hypothetical protein
MIKPPANKIIRYMNGSAGSLVVSEGNGTISREMVRIAPGEAFKPGTVMVRNSSGVYEAIAKPSATNFNRFRVSNQQGDLNRFRATAGQANQQDMSAPVVLIAALEASDSERSGEVIARLAELSNSALVWPEGFSDEQIAGVTSALAAQNIILR